MVSWSLAGRESALTVMSRGLKRFWRNNSRKAIVVLATVFRLLFVAGGLGAMVAAAWVVALPLGLLALGIALLGFEWWVKR